jgi:cell shape-determining protein MreD
MIRWILFLIVTYVALVVQTTVGGLLVVHTGVGPIAPDLLAMVAVFVAMAVRNGTDAGLACWVLGLGLDLASGPGGTTVVGPMAVAFGLGGLAIFRLRETLFRDKVVTQVVMVLLFTAATHMLWLTLQAIFTRSLTWGDYGDALLQAVMIGAYSAALAPLIHAFLLRHERLLLIVPGRRGRG